MASTRQFALSFSYRHCWWLLSTAMPETGNTRRHPRVQSPKGLFVAWEAGLQRNVSRMETLSLGGLFIRTSAPPPVGSMIRILIDMPSGEVRVRAIVRRVAPGLGMGIEFLFMAPEDRARLNHQLKLLFKQLESPAIP